MQTEITKDQARNMFSGFSYRVFKSDTNLFHFKGTKETNKSREEKKEYSNVIIRGFNPTFEQTEKLKLRMDIDTLLEMFSTFSDITITFSRNGSLLSYKVKP